jgi:hypothetical protein
MKYKRYTTVPNSNWKMVENGLFVCLFVWWCLTPLSTIFHDITEILLKDEYFHLKKIVRNWQILSHEGSQVHFVLDGNQTHNFSGDRR